MVQTDGRFTVAIDTPEAEGDGHELRVRAHVPGFRMATVFVPGAPSTGIFALPQDLVLEEDPLRILIASSVELSCENPVRSSIRLTDAHGETLEFFGAGLARGENGDRTLHLSHAGLFDGRDTTPRGTSRPGLRSSPSPLRCKVALAGLGF